MGPVVPSGVRRLLEVLRDAGGRPYLVGGAVRDALLGRRRHKDFDVEVFGLPCPQLKDALARVGRVDAVGEAFTVFKVSGLEGVDGAVDVSLPRRDSKAGPGHRGIAVVGDPDLTVEEAARRRDFTINAVMFDPVRGDVSSIPSAAAPTSTGALLRAVDPATFGEDPLRALRAVQLAARFELTVDPATARLCASMPLAELPAERVFGEIEKLLMKARRPSIGLALLREWGLLAAVAPELVPLIGTPQDPEWHPEGDVWTHTLLAVDQAVPLLDGPRRAARARRHAGRALPRPGQARHHAAAWKAACAPTATRKRARRPTSALLDRWNVHRPARLRRARARSSGWWATTSSPGSSTTTASASPTARSAAWPASASRRCSTAWPAPTAWAAPATSRPSRWSGSSIACASSRWPSGLRRRSCWAGTCSSWAWRPGPEVGRIVRAVYERQLDGAVSTLEEAREEARRMVTEGLETGRRRGGDGRAVSAQRPLVRAKSCRPCWPGRRAWAIAGGASSRRPAWACSRLRTPDADDVVHLYAPEEKGRAIVEALESARQDVPRLAAGGAPAARGDRRRARGRPRRLARAAGGEGRAAGARPRAAEAFAVDDDSALEPGRALPGGRRRRPRPRRPIPWPLSPSRSRAPLQPDAKEIERARLIAMAFAASKGDLDAFWTARKMRSQPAGGKTATQEVAARARGAQMGPLCAGSPEARRPSPASRSSTVIVRR